MSNIGININNDSSWQKYHDPETGVQYYKVLVGRDKYQIIVREGEYKSMANNYPVTMMGARIISVDAQSITTDNDNFNLDLLEN